VTRPSSWYPLAGSDPVPGDPGKVTASGERYRTVAAAIESAATRLRQLTSQTDGNQSDAVEAIRDNSAKVAGEISKADGRYMVVGDALVTYARQLAQAQAESLQALYVAQAAQHAVDQASSDVTRTARSLDETTDETERGVYQSKLNHARSSRDAADASLARARQDLEAAVSLRDQAAQQAISSIESKTDNDGLNDGWWENWGSELFNTVSKVFSGLASVFGVLALVLAWVPVLGEALAAVALIAGAVALVADIVLKIAGEGSWVNIAIGVLGLVTFGAGRIAGAALKVGSRAALGSARLAAGSAAAASPAVRAAQGLSAARNSMTAIAEIAGPGASALTKTSARGLALEGAALKSSQGVRDLFAALKPGAVLSDTRSSIAGALTRTPGGFADWGAAFRAGGTDVTTAAAAGPQALVAILSGEREASATLSQLSHVAPELTGVSNQFATSMHLSNAVVGAASVATGADRSVMGYGAYSWLGDQFRPSSTTTLNLK
jgi:hypothetical protein